LKVTPIAVSSTDIRRRTRAGLSTRFLVPEKVRRYMITNRLYLPGEDTMHAPKEDRADPVEAVAQAIASQINDNKGEDIVILDMRGISPVADFFIIAHGRSTKHVQGMASKMQKELSRMHIRCISVEGEEEGNWILMDFGDVVVHLFYKPIRSFYDLEGLWHEAPRLPSRPIDIKQENTDA